MFAMSSSVISGQNFVGAFDIVGSNETEGVIDGSIEMVSEGLGANDTDGAADGGTLGTILGADDTVGALLGDAEGDRVGGSVFNIQRFER